MSKSLLAQLREEADLTQRELAKQTSVHHTTIAAYETERRKLTRDALRKLLDHPDLCKGLDSSAEEAVEFIGDIVLAEQWNRWVTEQYKEMTNYDKPLAERLSIARSIIKTLESIHDLDTPEVMKRVAREKLEAMNEAVNRMTTGELESLLNTANAPVESVKEMMEEEAPA